MARKQFPRDLERILKFHGHFCGGIVLGYRAARLGLKRLGAGPAIDEEIVAIVENDSCAVDAVQVLTGCTCGKGNLFYRDYGKHVYTFAERSSGRAVRISRKPGPRLSAEEQLKAPPEELFWVEETVIDVPAPSRLHDTVVCERCSEPVMETRTRQRGGRTLCMPCAKHRGASQRPSVKTRRRNPASAGV